MKKLLKKIRTEIGTVRKLAKAFMKELKTEEKKMVPAPVAATTVTSNEIRKRPGMRGGFSFVEIMISIVIVGIIATLIYSSLSGKSDKIEVESTLKADMDELVQGALKLREANRGEATPYLDIGANTLDLYVADKMELSDNDGDITTNEPTLDYLKSLGFNGLCNYYAIEDKDVAAGRDGFGVKYLMDCSAAATNWDDTAKRNAERIFVRGLKRLSRGTVEEVYDATAIGLANNAFTLGGSATDAIAGVRYFSN